MSNCATPMLHDWYFGGAEAGLVGEALRWEYPGDDESPAMAVIAVLGDFAELVWVVDADDLSDCIAGFQFGPRPGRPGRLRRLAAQGWRRHGC